MRTEKSLKEHVKDIIGCKPTNSPSKSSGASDVTQEDAEDGITTETCEMLCARSTRVKVDSWKKLWQILFPLDGDLEIPLPGKVSLPWFEFASAWHAN
jgi:hypothetical protein